MFMHTTVTKIPITFWTLIHILWLVSHKALVTTLTVHNIIKKILEYLELDDLQVRNNLFVSYIIYGIDL